MLRSSDGIGEIQTYRTDWRYFQALIIAKYVAGFFYYFILFIFIIIIFYVIKKTSMYSLVTRIV